VLFNNEQYLSPTTIFATSGAIQACFRQSSDTQQRYSKWIALLRIAALLEARLSGAWGCKNRLGS